MDHGPTLVKDWHEIHRSWIWFIIKPPKKIGWFTIFINTISYGHFWCALNDFHLKHILQMNFATLPKIYAVIQPMNYLNTVSNL